MDIPDEAVFYLSDQTYMNVVENLTEGDRAKINLKLVRQEIHLWWEKGEYSKYLFKEHKDCHLAFMLLLISICSNKISLHSLKEGLPLSGITSKKYLLTLINHLLTISNRNTFSSLYLTMRNKLMRMFMELRSNLLIKY